MYENKLNILFLTSINQKKAEKRFKKLLKKVVFKEKKTHEAVLLGVKFKRKTPSYV